MGGSGAATWAERTRAFERRRIELGGTAPAARAAEVARRDRAIERIIVEGGDPAGNAALAADWAQLASADAKTMYGRPLTFHQQAQTANWAAAWSASREPVLATIGANDWFEEEDGVRLIADAARAGGATAEVAVIPGLDHHFERFADMRAAFVGKGGTIDPEPFLRVALPWIRARLAAPPQA